MRHCSKIHTRDALRHYKELLTIIRISSSTPSDRHPHSSFLAHAIQDHYQLPLTLFISFSLSSCHLAHKEVLCILHFVLTLFFTFSHLYLPLSIFRFQCTAVLSLLLVTILLTSLLSLSTIILSTSSLGFSLISCSQFVHSSPCSPCPQSSLALPASAPRSSPAPKMPSLLSMHMQLFNVSFSWKSLSSSTSSSLTSPLPISRMLFLRSFIHFISLCLQASTVFNCQDSTWSRVESPCMPNLMTWNHFLGLQEMI